MSVGNSLFMRVVELGLVFLALSICGVVLFDAMFFVLWFSGCLIFKAILYLFENIVQRIEYNKQLEELDGEMVSQFLDSIEGEIDENA